MNIINSILCDKRLIVGENIILKKIYVLYFKIGTRIFSLKNMVKLNTYEGWL